jgi:phospho-N-acetylmuramoyl-pentapeptide-transferase
MLYHLLIPLRVHFSVLNLFRYITFRAAYATVTALALCFILGPPVIRFLRRRRVNEAIYEEAPERHLAKGGTPTMGGILILAAILIPTLLWADLTNRFVHVVIFATLWLGVLGFVDDYRKLRGHRRGIPKHVKLFWQTLLGIVIGLYLMFYPFSPEVATRTSLLFFKNSFLPLGYFYVIFVALVIVGTSNAVNLTDGLDGLATGILLFAAAAYAAMSYVTGHSKIAEYLNVLFLNGSGELAVFCAAIVGAALGFLWFNAHPAQIFMGDTGSLALGGAIGTVAVLIKQEILLLIVGGVFVIEAGSVILQVIYYRWRGKRLFKMAPLHHHFEMLGWSESKIVVRFWILAAIFALIALSTLKIR